LPQREKFPSVVIHGTLHDPPCSSAPLMVSNNSWNQGVVFPGPAMVPGNVQVRSDRNGCAGAAIDLVDDAPSGPFAVCPADPPDPCGRFPFLCPHALPGTPAEPF
jgi:hypothetical protein